jgi:iron complex outermembrane receptor protein
MPNTPRWKAGLSLSTQVGAFYARLKARATSEAAGRPSPTTKPAPGYTTFGIDGGYTFANYGLLKNPKLSFNVSNITNKQYRNPSSTTVTNAVRLTRASRPAYAALLPGRTALRIGHPVGRHLIEG